MRDHVKHTFLIEIDRIITGSNPIAIAVNQSIIQCQEPESLVDIQHRGECLFQLINWRFVKRLTKLDQGAPGFIVFICFECITRFVALDIVAEIFQTTSSHWTSWNFPSRTFCTGIILGQEFFVVLLSIDVHAPAFAVHCHFDKVGLRRGDVFSSDVRIKHCM